MSAAESLRDQLAIEGYAHFRRADVVAVLAELEEMRTVLTRIRDEDSQSNHDPSYSGCHCAYCLASRALSAAATQETR